MIFLLQMSVDSINYITLFKPGCFVPRMDKVLLQHVGRFNVNQEMMLKIPLSFSDSPAILAVILTQVSSTYLSQWLGAVPVNVTKALF